MVKNFHGTAAPGVLIGGHMVDRALRDLPGGFLYDAISETGKCLPDAIQLLTPCTIGNGWLKIIDIGRYALSFYNKENGKGMRVFLDAEKIRPWPDINVWLFKLKSKQEQDSERLIRQIEEAGDTILSTQGVQVHPESVMKKRKGAVAVCPGCREAYPADNGNMCQGCQGRLPYIS